MVETQLQSLLYSFVLVYSSFLHDCVAKYIEVKIEAFIGNIKCPGLSCKHLIDPLSCRSIISKQLLERWRDLICDSMAVGLDKCDCPYRKRRVLDLNESGEELSKIKCPNCKKTSVSNVNSIACRILKQQDWAVERYYCWAAHRREELDQILFQCS